MLAATCPARSPRAIASRRPSSASGCSHAPGAVRARRHAWSSQMAALSSITQPGGLSSSQSLVQRGNGALPMRAHGSRGARSRGFLRAMARASWNWNALAAFENGVQRFHRGLESRDALLPQPAQVGLARARSRRRTGAASRTSTCGTARWGEVMSHARSRSKRSRKRGKRFTCGCAARAAAAARARRRRARRARGAWKFARHFTYST
jgi:hypothetical protein